MKFLSHLGGLIVGGDAALTGDVVPTPPPLVLPPPPFNRSPVASIAYSVTDTTVRVDGGTSTDPDGTVVGWVWDFDDGTTATGVTATHTYTSAGVYTVGLTVTDDGGATASTTRRVTVTAPASLPPTASFTWTVADLSVVVDSGASSDPDGTITTQQWSWGDGTTSTGASVIHTYMAPGEYTVQLTVTDDEGLTATTTRKVAVTAPVVVTPDAPVLTSISEPEPKALRVDWDVASEPAGLVEVRIYEAQDPDHYWPIKPGVGYRQSGPYLVVGVEHTYWARFVVAGVVSGESNRLSRVVQGDVTVEPDPILTVQPPTNVRVTGYTDTTISIAWDPPTNGNVGSYRTRLDGAYQAQPSSSTEVYTYTGLVVGQEYRLSVQTYVGGEASTEVNVYYTIPGGTPDVDPTPDPNPQPEPEPDPTTITATADPVDPWRFYLAWPEDADGYQLNRVGTEEYIRTTDADFHSPFLPPGQHTYRVRRQISATVNTDGTTTYGYGPWESAPTVTLRPHPAPVGNELKWRPPFDATTPGVKTVTVSSTATKVTIREPGDYIVKFPTSGPVTLPFDARFDFNVICEVPGDIRVSVVGGEIKAQGRPSNGVGMKLYGRMASAHDKLEVFIEGFRLSGGQEQDGFEIDFQTNLNSKVVFQNCHVERIYGTGPGAHADDIQSWGGPMALLTYRFLGESDYQGVFLHPTQFGITKDNPSMSSYYGHWNFDRMTMHMHPKPSDPSSSGIGFFTQHDWTTHNPRIDYQECYVAWASADAVPGGDISTGAPLSSGHQKPGIWDRVKRVGALSNVPANVKPLTGVHTPGVSYQSPGYAPVPAGGSTPVEPDPEPEPVPEPPVSGPWLSGASGAEAADGTLATWRGRPVDIIGTWSDADADAQVYQWTTHPDHAALADNISEWQGDVELAIGAIFAGETWAQAAAGAYDVRWGQALDNAEESWLGKPGSMKIRWAHEFNLDGNYPWTVHAGEEADFVTAVARFRALWDARMDARHRFNLCPNNDTTVPGLDLTRIMTDAAPHVHIYGVDVYNQYTHATTYEQAQAKFLETKDGHPKGPEAHRQLAESLGLPFAISEWSSNGNDGDSPEYIRAKYDWLTAHGGTGAGKVAYEVLFNLWTQFQLYPTTVQPNAAAKYAELWGGGEPTEPAFVYGETEPTAANTGLTDEAVLTPYSGGITFSGSDDPANPTVIRDKTISTRMDWRGGYVLFENCDFTWDGRNPDGTIISEPGGMIENWGDHVGLVTARRCRFRPARGHARMDAIAGKKYTLDRCDISGTTDGFGAFSSTDQDLDVTVIGCYFHEARFWTEAEWGQQVHPSDTITHNDGGGQIQGGGHVTIEGNTFYGYMENGWDGGVPAAPNHRYHQGVLVQQNITSEGAYYSHDIKINRNFWYGCRQCIVLATRRDGNGVPYDIEIKGNRWMELPEDFGGSRPYHTVVQEGVGITINGRTYPSTGENPDLDGNIYADVPAIPADKRGQPITHRSAT